MRKRTVVVNDRLQRSYRYELAARQGRDFDPEFRPDSPPQEILRQGVFSGKYMTDTRRPASPLRIDRLGTLGAAVGGEGELLDLRLRLL